MDFQGVQVNAGCQTVRFAIYSSWLKWLIVVRKRVKN